MVTRGFLGFIFKDRSTRGCRQQYDTYPTGLGQWIVDFLQTLKEDEFELMAERVDAIEVRVGGRVLGIEKADMVVAGSLKLRERSKGLGDLH
jgi:hypothetical protein